MENEKITDMQISPERGLKINVKQLGTLFEPGETQNFRSLLGEKGEELLRLYSYKNTGEYVDIPDSLKKHASLELNQRLAEVYDITPDQVEFLMPHAWQIESRAIKDLVKDMAPTIEGSLEQRNAVDLIDGQDMSAIIPLLARASDPRTRHETERQMLLTHFAASFELRNRRLEIPKKARLAQEALDEHYFVPGSTQELNIYSMHRESDNKTLGVCNQHPYETTSEPVRWKKHVFEVRVTANGDLVAISTRRKGTGNGVFKTFGKAASNGGKMDIEYVEDALGIMFVHMGHIDENNTWVPPIPEDIDRMTLETVDSLANNLDVHWYVEDDDAGSNRGQSPHAQFIRRQVFLNGSSNSSDNPIPLEFMYFTPEQFFDYQYHTGEWNLEEQKYDGCAHDLFNWSRHRPTMRRLFPSENKQGEPLYNADALEEAMLLQQEKIVQELKDMNTIEPYPNVHITHASAFPRQVIVLD